jgi:hypothetical protein
MKSGTIVHWHSCTTLLGQQPAVPVTGVGLPDPVGLSLTEVQACMHDSASV